MMCYKHRTRENSPDTWSGTPTAAWFVVCDGEAISGYGATAYGSRADFEATMRSEGTAVLADDEDPARAGWIVDTSGYHV